MVSFAIERGLLEPGSWTRIKLNWHVSSLDDSSAKELSQNLPSEMTVYLTDSNKKIVAERSFASMFTSFQTSRRAEDELYPIYTAIHVPDGLPSGAYSLRVRIDALGRDDLNNELTYEKSGAADCPLR